MVDSPRLPTWLTWDRIRDAVLFFAGLGLALNQAVIDKVDRPSVLILAAGMMGLPAFLPRKDGEGSK